MKNSLVNKIALCDKCGHAFIMNVEGDDETCDGCLADKELGNELINEGFIEGQDYGELVLFLDNFDEVCFFVSDEGYLAMRIDERPDTND